MRVSRVIISGVTRVLSRLITRTALSRSVYDGSAEAKPSSQWASAGLIAFNYNHEDRKVKSSRDTGFVCLRSAVARTRREAQTFSKLKN